MKEFDVKELQALVDAKDVEKIKEFMREYDLVIKEGKIVPRDTSEYDFKANLMNLKQYVKKIFLNSSYGALLQNSSVFYDFRLGSSTTLSGRMVWKNLASEASNQLTGVYACNGENQQYGDTDSVYMTLDTDAFRAKYPNFDYTDKDAIIKFADEVGDNITKSFPDYMKRTFHCNDDGAKLQAAGREVVAERGLFVSKKRYALLVIDKEGIRCDVHGKAGKMKIMGLQVQRSDCPMLVRALLKQMLEKLLTNGDKQALLNILKEFGETKWKELKPWEKGTPKACNKLTQYTEQYAKTGKCSVGQVMAAINWNMLIDINNDETTPKILDGNKVIVCKLIPQNGLAMSSVAFPVDLVQFPNWFKELPFDEQSMKDSVVDKTIDTVFGVLNWKLTMENAIVGESDLDGFLSYDC